MGIEGWLGALVLIVGLILSLVQLRAKERRFPPGPSAWPVIGHINLISKLPHQVLRDMSQTYGHIIGLRLGQQKAVVVSSPELAKEILNTHDKIFANRPPYRLSSTLFYKNSLAFNFYGPQWTKLRKACVVELLSPKRLQQLEGVHREELHLLMRQIDEDSNGNTRAIEISRYIGLMSTRVTMRLFQSKAAIEVAGENLHELISEIVQEISPTLGDFIPWLSCLDFFQMRRMRMFHARIDKVMSTILAERKQSAFQEHDFLQALLSKEADPNSTTLQPEALSLHEIKGVLSDLMVAGIHSTALTIEWAMAELLRNGHSFQRLRQEISTMVGEKKHLSNEDVAKLSYLKCITREVFRLHPVLPLLVPHLSAKECKVQGYILPKNTIMFVNAWAIGRDEKVWGANANDFVPERFESKDMDVKGQHYELLPFGSGRRICLGMTLGLSMVEITLANLVNNYDWELPIGSKSINMDEQEGSITNSKASPLLAIPRLRLFSSI